MLDYFFKGIVIGLLFGLPVGAVGAMTVQRTWSFGLRAGLLTGLGSSAADCFYAVVGAFGLTVISEFLMAYQTAITVAGGALVLYLGVRLLRQPEQTVCQEAQPERIPTIRLFLSSFAVGITNPAAILTFLFAFTYFGISDLRHPADGVCLVTGVLAGTYAWWLSLSLGTWVVKHKVGARRAFRTNRLFGSMLILFSAVIFLRLIR